MKEVREAGLLLNKCLANSTGINKILTANSSKIQQVVIALTLTILTSCQLTENKYEIGIEQRPSGTYGDWKTVSSQVGKLYWIKSEASGTSSTIDSTSNAKVSVHRRLFSLETKHAEICSRKFCISNDCRLVSDWELTWLTPDRSRYEVRKRLQLSTDRKSLLPVSASDNAEILRALNSYSSLVLEPVKRCAFGPILRFKIKGAHHLYLSVAETKDKYGLDDIFAEPLDPKPLKFEEKSKAQSQGFMHDFSAGKVELRRMVPLNPLSKLRIAKDLLKVSRLYRDQRWRVLSETIVVQNISTPENYHLMGLAAYKLGFSSAAKIYLEKAIALTEKFTPKVCAPGYCFDLQLPRDSAVLLRKTMRSL